MPVAVGSRLGPYEIVAPLGAGGMGEVFKARDTRLERSVAIKVLPAEFAENAQLKIRFEREAKTISQLNHPNICTLHDVGDGYLVMELLDGESLADRLVKGPLPISDTLRIGAQIADALDRAHRAGVVHRDLKPANIMLTKSGAKLLDFGLAKSGAPVALDGATQHKPLTQEGTILGTFQYMAPEQLEGLDADARTDIFALGAVLYEMATGKRAFQGSSKTSLIAAIVTADPQPISAIQPLTPPAFEHVVRKCLAKDRESRWQSAYDVAEELRWLSETGMQTAVVRRAKGVSMLAIAAAVVLAVAMAAIAWFSASRMTRAQERSAVYRVTITTPPGSVLGYAGGSMELSPDGRMLVYPSSSSTGGGLLVRKLSDANWRTLEGTAGATQPFWSPDSKQIAYYARGSLWKTAADGSGAAEEITRAESGLSGTWSRNGVIVISQAGSLFRVNASGGQLVPLKSTAGQSLAACPNFLPDGRHVIFSAQRNLEEVDYFIATSDDSTSPKRIGNGENNAKYADGYLFFVRGGALQAQPFDVGKLELTGEPTSIAKVQGFDQAAYFSVAGDTLVYLPQGSEVRTELTRVDRNGKRISTLGVPEFFFSPRVSHDGSRIGVDESASQGPGDLWLFDASSGASTRFTFAPENESGPLWGPGDTEVMYFMNQASGKAVLMRKRIDGGQPVVAFERSGSTVTGDWSPDGASTLAEIRNGLVGAPGQFVAFDCRTWKPLAPPINGTAPRFSPDGRWVAYSSDENARLAEIFVQPFPPNGSKWQVSADGGLMPVWRRDGKALYFVNSGGKLVESLVNIDASGTFSSQSPQPLFGVALREGVPFIAQYDVFPDGTFLLNRIPDTASTPMSAVIHWKEALGK